MKLNDGQLKELEAHCNAALKRKTVKGQLLAMGPWFNVDLHALPRPARTKFRRVLRLVALTTFTGVVPARSRR